VLLFVIGVVWVVAAGAWAWTQRQYYVGDSDGQVTIYRGINADLPGLDMSQPYETSDVALADLSDYDQNQVREGIGLGNLDDARRAVDNLSAERVPPEGGNTASDRSAGS
jgi:protein phosphatase